MQIAVGLSDSSDSVDFMPSRVSERKSYFKFPFLHENQMTLKVSDMEIGDLNDTFRPMELQDTKAKDSERKMLDLMIFQTKQLEQTKMTFEEAKLEIKNLKESIRKKERSARMSGRKSDSKKIEALESVHARSQEEIIKLRNELRLALEADDKSKKAIDYFAITLKEVSTVANQAKKQHTIEKSELHKAIEEVKNTKSLLQITEQKLMNALDCHENMKLEYAESISSSKAKEDSFLSCMKISEENLTKWKHENSSLKNDAWKVAREDNTKLRQVMKQAVNEAIALKEALEIVRSENSQMKDQLFEKDYNLQQIQMDYETLKVSEADAVHSVSELNNLVASSNLTDFGPIRLTQVTNAKARRSLSIFSSEKWRSDNKLNLHRRRHSVGEQEVFKRSTFEREKSIESSSVMFSSLKKVPSSLLSGEKGTIDTDGFDHVEGDMKVKKKKTVFGRVGDVLRRTSFHKWFSTFM